MVQQAVDAWGKVDILINNAGFLRDQMIFSMERGRLGRRHQRPPQGPLLPDPPRHRPLAGPAQGRRADLDARIINTASPSGLYGNVGQSNYGAAKAGIAALTTVWALELDRLGVTVNCLAPTAMTRLVMDVMGGEDAVSDDMKESMAPRWISAVVAWLCSDEARNVTGRVFDIRGDRFAGRRGLARRPRRREHRRPHRARPGDGQAHGRGPAQQRPLRRRRRRPRPAVPHHLRPSATRTSPMDDAERSSYRGRCRCDPGRRAPPFELTAAVLNDARIFHVNINCADLARSRAFYVERCGLAEGVRTSPEHPQDGEAFGFERAWWDALILIGADGFDGGAIDLLPVARARAVGGPAARPGRTRLPAHRSGGRRSPGLCRGAARRCCAERTDRRSSATRTALRSSSRKVRRSGSGVRGGHLR